jgi:hypothetical protein
MSVVQVQVQGAQIVADRRSPPTASRQQQANKLNNTHLGI